MFTRNEIPKEIIHYFCIPAISTDSVLKVDKNIYPQGYLQECKYKMKKRELVSIIDDEEYLSSDESDLDD